MSHLAHATKVFPLGNALFATKALIGPGQIRHVNMEAHTELAWWDWLIATGQVHLCTSSCCYGSLTTTCTLMHQAPGAAMHGRCHTGSRFSGPLRRPYLVLRSKRYSQLSLRQQCGVPFGQVSSFFAIEPLQQPSDGEVENMANQVSNVFPHIPCHII